MRVVLLASVAWALVATAIAGVLAMARADEGEDDPPVCWGTRYALRCSRCGGVMGYADVPRFYEDNDLDARAIVQVIATGADLSHGATCPERTSDAVDS